MTRARSVLGWDIGGVNTKAVRVRLTNGATPELESAAVPYEIQHDLAALADTLRLLAQRLGPAEGWAHAVTMTAELSQAFRTKREGVGAVLDGVLAAFPSDPVRVFTVDGRFVDPDEARVIPLAVAASNWVATAAVAARLAPDAILIDIGTTSTDIVPIVAGRVAARGRTDPARLSTGELVYTGAVRTPLEAIVREVPLWGGRATVAAEAFATIGDAHIWLGSLAAEDYTAPTSDRRPVTREGAGERLARVVCGDRDMLDDVAIDGIARAAVAAQTEQVVNGLRRVREAHPQLSTAIVTGLGEFIAAEAAGRADLDVVSLASHWGSAARVAPAAAVGWLLAEELGNTE
ncbi:MAG TPA: hydantoinase/oxoprolinase family protein [Gemmatimonadales bacterium]|nr:hydantoinase/oxoprolinase family protein [Gemmatimonadales bacterium]